MSFEVARTNAEGGTGHPTTLAVVVEGHRLAAGLVDASGLVVVRDRIATPSREVWGILERLIGRVVAAAPAGTLAPSNVAVTCSGPIDTRAGSVSPPYIPSWSGFPVRDRLAELMSLPVVLDSIAGAAADARVAQATEPRSDFIEVMLGQSVDSACVVSGRRLRGAHGNAGSITHIIVEPGGKECWCGGLGCAEAYVGSSAIEAEINRPLQRATPSTVERTGIMLGRALASMAAVVDAPSAVVSGPLMETFGGPLLAAAQTEVDTRARLGNLADMKVESVAPIAPLVAAVSVVHDARAEWSSTAEDRAQG